MVELWELSQRPHHSSNAIDVDLVGTVFHLLSNDKFGFAKAITHHIS